MDKSLDKIKSRFRSFWNNEPIEGCMLSIFVTDDYEKEPIPSNHEDLISYWTDGERVNKRIQKK